MFKFQKLILVLLVFTSQSLLAGTMGPSCKPGSLSQPCPFGKWVFGGEALYLQATYPSANFLNLTIDSLHKGTFNKIENDWGWGFELGAAYLFNSGNGINLDWIHFNKPSSNQINIPAGSSVYASATVHSPGPISLNVSRKTEWDAVNLESFQRIQFSNNNVLVVSGGAQYARLNTTGSLTGPVSVAVMPYSDTRTYSGGGPRIGAELTYLLIKNFSLYGGGATSLLVGYNKYSSSYTDTVGSGTLKASTTAVIPELEGKLGVEYDYAIGQSYLNLDVGWMWYSYFNAHLYPNSALNMIQSNIDFQGLYFGLKWLGNLL